MPSSAVAASSGLAASGCASAELGLGVCLRLLGVAHALARLTLAAAGPPDRGSSPPTRDHDGQRRDAARQVASATTRLRERTRRRAAWFRARSFSFVWFVVVRPDSWRTLELAHDRERDRRSSSHRRPGAAAHRSRTAGPCCVTLAVAVPPEILQVSNLRARDHDGVAPELLRRPPRTNRRARPPAAAACPRCATSVISAQAARRVAARERREVLAHDDLGVVRRWRRRAEVLILAHLHTRPARPTRRGPPRSPSASISRGSA